jgi:hypothetical protein
MFGFLRQATASQSRTLGPFVSTTDFSTLRDDLTIASTDVKLFKNGGASTNKNSGGGTSRGNGEYSVTFDATDTATVGELSVSVKMSGALAVRRVFHVLEENVYDALFVSGAAFGTQIESIDAALANRVIPPAQSPWRDGEIEVTGGDNYVGDFNISKDFYDADNDLTDASWTARMTWKNRNGDVLFTATSTFEAVAGQADWYRLKYRPLAADTESGPFGRNVLYDVQFNGPGGIKDTREHGWVTIKKPVTTPSEEP